MESTIRPSFPPPPLLYVAFRQINLELLRNDGERSEMASIHLPSVHLSSPFFLPFCSLNKKRDYGW